jgi:hypothetical protein
MLGATMTLAADGKQSDKGHSWLSVRTSRQRVGTTRRTGGTISAAAVIGFERVGSTKTPRAVIELRQQSGCMPAMTAVLIHEPSAQAVVVRARHGGDVGLRGLYVDHLRAGSHPYSRRATIIRGVHAIVHAAIIDTQGAGRTDA